ncbi:MAG: hypothetical protein LBR42_03260 [Candidatus Methanoplasma sp.]|jgi:hypothetical protein|nr:hypothetical protein [Candidatus Methanoplasma sp.]
MALLAAIAVATPLFATTVSAETNAEEDSSKWYYNQLDVNGKAIYDALSTTDPSITSATVNLPVTLWAKSNIQGEAEELLEASFRKTINLAYDAVRISSPLSFWVWDRSALHSVPNVEREPAEAGYRYVYSLSSATFTLSLDLYRTADADFPGVQKMIEDIRTVVDNFSSDSTTMRGKVLDINNYLTNLITYDPHAGTTGRSIYAHDAYGALAGPSNYAVCDGYSKAFLLLCEKEGIDCVIVLGTEIQDYINHAWNYVKMEDGKWYAIDVTWNDSSGNAYFLAGGETFFASHQEGIYLNTGTPTYDLESPVVSMSPYDPPAISPSILFALITVAMIGGIVLVLMYLQGRRHHRKKHHN